MSHAAQALSIVAAAVASRIHDEGFILDTRSFEDAVHEMASLLASGTYGEVIVKEAYNGALAVATCGASWRVA